MDLWIMAMKVHFTFSTAQKPSDVVLVEGTHNIEVIIIENEHYDLSLNGWLFVFHIVQKTLRKTFLQR